VYGLPCKHLMRYLLRMSGEDMISLMLGAMGTHGHASEPESHGARGDVKALPHWEAGLEPQDTW
jgi:hypothetical protein